MGLPTGIYRADMLPFHDYNPNKNTATITHVPLNGDSEQSTELVPLEVEEEEHQAQNAKGLECELQEILVPEVKEYRIAGFLSEELRPAFVPLQYEEGFPAFEDGIPFWSRLEFEPIEAFQAFQAYIRMSKGRKASDADDEYDGKAAAGSRSISRLVAETYPDADPNTMIGILNDWYHMYYWGLRAHSYDLYRVAEFRKQQEVRAVETQGEHYHEARRLRHRLNQFIESDDEFWDLMTPQVAVKMYEMLTKQERISAGLPAQGPRVEGDGEGRSSQPFEMVLRQVAQTGRRDAGHTLSEDGDVLDQAMDDPAMVEVLQELIIKGMS